MDKIKERLGPNIKYVFWVVWAILMIASVAIWWLATGGLIADADTNQTAIKGARSTLIQIQGTADTHPNDFSHGKMEGRVEDAKNDVYEAWKTQWEYQETIMVWPTELNRAGTNDFVVAFDGDPNVVPRQHRYLPIETTTEFPMPEAEEVDQTLRKRYLEYIEEQLPGLAATAGAKWTANFKSASAAGGGGFGGFGETSFDFGGDASSSERLIMRREDEPLVAWSTGSQAALLDRVFPWRTKEAPSTLDILYSQEDLWVLKNLLEIISTVNGNAKKPFQATIHEIIEIQLGKAVAGRVGTISQVVSTTGLDESGMMDSSGGSMMDAGSLDGTAVTFDPADNRYIDIANAPIPAATLRTAMEGKSPENAFMNVAKRLPVKLALMMDQRKLPDLMSACGNARLMVEIRQVRINTSSAGATGAASFGGGGSGFGAGGGFGSSGFGSSFEAVGTGTAAASVPDDYPYDLPIEVYGVIYIYNPPDVDKLGVEAVTTETVMTGKAGGEKPDPDSDPDPDASPEDEVKPEDAPADDKAKEAAAS